ncbi:sugar phosphate isomerase/epimerase family protein [Halococcus thailandensis]|uniref:Xylose isomerase domain-containing protein TIM barrel n=1 Tax=Halococcus thailandensis JCM 13552 TaxID=1227457 RepID=M0MXL1_9EURY|nr:TIM barrel protein [Halococcus thailandensis]EMA49569.1 Xylose isomerase domain-containing protein TIM barrel [Halococcus thailandensis JCM 13552]
MLIAGKCPPEPDALAAAADRGFEAVELYLERHHLEPVEETIDAVTSSDVRIVSVHTPHVPLAEREYLDRTDRLATACDAYVVFHSRFVNHVDTADVEALDLRSPYGYENKTGVSARHLRHMVLRPGHDLVLDVAHLFMAEREYLDELESLLVEYGDRIEVIHLCDSTPVQDGLAFGAGDIDMTATARLLDRHFEGIVVLEVMPDDQRAALEAFAATQSNDLSRMIAIGD